MSSKTRRRIPSILDLSGGFPGLLSDRSDNFQKILNQKSEDVYSRPWHRLENGVRLNRIRLFAADEAARFQFTTEEQNTL